MSRKVYFFSKLKISFGFRLNSKSWIDNKKSNFENGLSITIQSTSNPDWAIYQSNPATPWVQSYHYEHYCVAISNQLISCTRGPQVVDILMTSHKELSLKKCWPLSLVCFYVSAKDFLKRDTFLVTFEHFHSSVFFSWF